VPLALRERVQWVVWQYEWNEKKWTKVPYRVGPKSRASSTSSEQWSTFEEAVKAWLASDDLDGIMFAIAPDDPFCGIDLDECRNTKGHIATEAQEIIDEFASYTEVSPSTEGVKLFILGKKPDFADCRSTKVGGFGEIEIYDHDRFFVVTGAHLDGTPTTIEERQELLKALCARYWAHQPRSPVARDRPATPLDLDDDALLEKIRNSKHGPKFEQLWNGDTSAYGGDDSRADLALCGVLAFWTGGDLHQVDSLFRQSNLMRSKWDQRRGKTTYGERTIAKALRGKTEFYAPLKRSKRAIAVQPSECGADLKKRAELLTDVGNAARLVVRHGHRIRYCHATGIWYVWNKTHWQADERGRIVELCKETALSILDEAKVADENARGGLVAWSMKSQKRERLTAMAALAQPDVAVTADDLDRDHNLFNCRNGTLDLRTGELRAHDPNDLITRVAPVAYDAHAICPLFDEFLNTTFSGDVELMEFVHRWHGHCLTGDVREQYIAIYMGEGNNGKSVLLDTISGLMGPYVGEAPPDLLTVRKHPEHPTEIADLMGKRLVVGSETERDVELRIQLIKRLTGNAKLKGRFMRQDYVEFARTHKLMLLTNNPPRIKEDTEAVWRRVLVVPFGHIVPPKKRDKLLLKKLEAEWPGILAWLVRGCMAWQESGLAIPSAITLATTKLRGRTDSVQAFLHECCVIDAGALTITETLYEAYGQFCDERRLRHEDSKHVAHVLREKDCEDGKYKGARCWFGIALKDAFGHVGRDGHELSHEQLKCAHEALNGQPASNTSDVSTKPTSRGQEA